MRAIPVDLPTDQEDLINASVLASERGDQSMFRMLEAIEAEHDEEPCPAHGPCAGYQLARDYLSGLVPPMGGFVRLDVRESEAT